MKTPPVHAEVIKAWAVGNDIQFQNHFMAAKNEWRDCAFTPAWLPGVAYRIKPEPKPDCYITLHLGVLEGGGFSLLGGKENILAVLDGETGTLKSVEMIK